MTRLVIAGASGHARVVADVVRSRDDRRVVGFLAPDLPPGASVDGDPVLGDDDELAEIARAGGADGWVCGMGDNARRRGVTERLGSLAPELPNPAVVHASATIAPGVVLGAGTVVMAGVVINVGTSIGRGCVVNTSASVDHDGEISDFANLSPGVVLGGGCRVGSGSFVGLGAKVIHNVTIGRDTVVGAGALVTRDLPDNVVAYGIPARVVRDRTSTDPYL